MIIGCQSLLLACGPGEGDLASAGTSATTAATDTDAGATSAAVTDGTTATPTGSSTAATTASEGESATSVAPCGNGTLDDDEACDDGNLVNGDGCNNDCTASAALVWEYRSGLLDFDMFNGVATSADGRIFAVGAKFTEGGTHERWVAELKNSALVWSETYEHGAYEAAFAVAVHGSSMYVAGTTMAALDNRDAWTAKLDLDGKIIWEDEFDSGFGVDFLTNLAVTPEGDVVVTGIASVEGGLGAVWTRRYGASGDVQWTHQIPSQREPFFANGPGVTATAAQVVVGFYRNPEPDVFQSVLIGYPPGGGEPAWIEDLPTSGTVLGITSDPGGGLIAALQDNASDQFVVDRATSTGQLLWSSSECTGTYGKAVAIDGQGDIIAIGGGWSAKGDNIRLCKFTAEGKLRWAKDLDGDAGDDLGLAVAILPDDRIVAAGRMWGGDEGKTDAWLAVFTP